MRNKYIFSLLFVFILGLPFLLKYFKFPEVNNVAQVFSSISVPAFTPIEIEAESGTLVAPFQAKDGYVYTTTRDAGSVTYNFSVPKDDNYVIQVLVDNPNNYTNINTFIDSNTPTKINFISTASVKPTTGFEWRSFIFSPANNNQVWLTSGNHTLSFQGGHANIKIDKIKITKMEKIISPSVTASTNIDGNVTVMNAGLKLENQDASPCYMSGEKYICGIRSGMYKFETLVKLPRILTPGDYWVFVKSAGVGSLDVSTTDQSTQKISPNDSDTDLLWTNMGHLKVTRNVDHVVITLYRKGSVLSTNELPNLYGIYITTDHLEKLNKYDVVVKDTPTSGGSSSPIKKGNLIPNGSFEAGIMSDWVLNNRYDVLGQNSKSTPFNSIIDNSLGYSGNSSIKISPDRADNTTFQYLDSRVYHLEPGKDYSLSFKAKSASGKTPRVTASLYNVNDVNIKTEQHFYLNDDWQNISIKTTAVGAPTADYRIRFWVLGWGSKASESDVWIDDVQLEEGDVTNYVPANDLEVGLSFSKISNLFLEDESVSGNLKFYNATNQNLSKMFHYEIYDHMNLLVDKNSFNVSVNALTSKVLSFNPTVNKRGIFRVIMWIEGQETVEKEITFSVLPRPRTGDIDKSFVGIHGMLEDDQLPILKRLGINWLRIFSTAQFVNWEFVEPTDDNFVWYDSFLQKAKNYGFKLLGTLGDDIPAWATDQNGYPDLEKWTDYVSKMAVHYKGIIDAWEVENEPNHSLPSSHYMEMLKRAVDVIEVADQNVKIVALGGMAYGNMPYLTQVMNGLKSSYPDWKLEEHADALSMHAYVNSTGVPSAKTILTDVYGLPVWNTETGAWDMGFYAGDFSSFYTMGVPTYPFKVSDAYYRGNLKQPEAVIQNFLSSIGGGHSKYFYYDARTTDQPFRTQATIIENDDSIRSKGIAYAIAANFIDYSNVIGAINLDPNVYAFLFERDGVSTLAIWSKDLRNRTLNTNLSSSQFKIFNMMGNQVSSTGGAISIGRTPIYIVSQGMNAASFESSVRSATVSSRGDVIPPNVLIASAPRDFATRNNIRIRWFAIDETSAPAVGDLDPEQFDPLPGANPNALLYSYRLTGLTDTWSSWGPNTFFDYSNLSDGLYTFEVKAKDEAGNISSVVTRTFRIGEGGEVVPSDPPITTTPEVPSSGGSSPSVPPPSSGGGGGGGGSSDLVSPVISSVINEKISSDGTIIRWITDEMSTSQVEYGLTSAYGNITSLNSGLVTNHSVSIFGLKPNTLYHYRVISSDLAGNKSISVDFSFTTTSLGGVITNNVPTLDVPPPSYQTSFKGTGNLSVNLQGNNPSYIRKGASFIDPGLSISGSRDFFFRIEAKLNGKDVGTINDIDVLNLPFGEHTITYTVKDSDGYIVTAERKLVINGTGAYEKPSINVSGPTGYNLSSKTGGADNTLGAINQNNISGVKPNIGIFNRNLRLGMSGVDIKNLQIFLNYIGFPVSSSGAGSPGKETNYFGPATHKALIKFQEANTSTILAPFGLTRGTGYFGPSTLKFVNQFLQK